MHIWDKVDEDCSFEEEVAQTDCEETTKVLKVVALKYEDSVAEVLKDCWG